MVRLRTVTLLLLVAAWCGVPATPALAHSALNGGTTLSSPTQAPWAVLVDAGGGVQCSGSLIDPAHVLTAAHCTLDSDGNAEPAGALTVFAGFSEGGNQSA